MHIYIFDIDGTLTFADGDRPNNTPYHTFAFWPLITKEFSNDWVSLSQAIERWKQQVEAQADPSRFSEMLMQESLASFKENVSKQDIRAYAKAITQDFLHHGIVRQTGIRLLNEFTEQGAQCVLSTGSYEDGAFGFLEALFDAGLIHKRVKDNILISGARVDWPKKTLLQGNLASLKVKGLERVLGISASEFAPNIQAVYGDDPFVNDIALFDLVPKARAFVIETAKNKSKLDYQSEHYTVVSGWD